jgi:hypothetical protein
MDSRYSAGSMDSRYSARYIYPADSPFFNAHRFISAYGGSRETGRMMTCSIDSRIVRYILYKHACISLNSDVRYAVGVQLELLAINP